MTTEVEYLGCFTQRKLSSLGLIRVPYLAFGVWTDRALAWRGYVGKLGLTSKNPMLIIISLCLVMIIIITMMMMMMMMILIYDK